LSQTAQDGLSGQIPVHRPTALKRKALKPLENYQRSVPSSTVTLESLRNLQTESFCTESKLPNHAESLMSRQRAANLGIFGHGVASSGNIKSECDMNYLAVTSKSLQHRTGEEVSSSSPCYVNSERLILNNSDAIQNSHAHVGVLSNSLGYEVQAVSPPLREHGDLIEQDMWRPW